MPWRLRSHLLNHEWIANSHEVGGIDCYSGCDASSCVAQHLRKRGQWQVRSTGWHSVREWLSMLPHMVVNQTTRCVVYAHVMCCCNAARGADAAEDKSLALALTPMEMLLTTSQSYSLGCLRVLVLMKLMMRYTMTMGMKALALAVRLLAWKTQTQLPVCHWCSKMDVQFMRRYVYELFCQCQASIGSFSLRLQA